MDKHLRALILEDSQSDTLLLLRELRQAGYEVDYTRVDTAEAMNAALDERSWDIILSDYSMPQFSAPAGLELIQDRRLDIPFIIVSGTMGEETAVEAMRAGAHDYFPKGRITRLAAAIERELREREDREQRRRTEKELRQAEERFAKAFQVSPIGITISSAEGYFLSANDSFRRMLGLETGEIVGQTALELGIWNNPTDQQILGIVSEDYGTVRDAEIILHSVSQDIRYVSISTERIDVSGDACVLAMWQDITDRKRAEQTLKKNAELIHLLQIVTVAANEATEIDNVLQFAIDQICTYADWSVGHLYMRSRGGVPRLTSARIWYLDDPTKFESFRQTSEQLQFDEISGGLVYRVFHRATREWIIDIRLDDDFVRSEVAHEAGIKAAYAFPILAHQEVVAVMEFFSTTDIDPDLALLDTIPQIAVQIGHMIERTRASDEIRALYNATAYLFNAENMQDLSRQIVQGVVEEFEHVDCGLLLVDPKTGRLDRLARVGKYHVNVYASLSVADRGLVPRAIREERIIYSPDVQQDDEYVANVDTTRSEMVVPLKTRNGVIGVLDLQSHQQDYFSESDQRVLGAFADRAAAALEITRLYEEINRYATQLELRVEERTQELQKAKERVEAILNNSSDAIILVDIDGRIQQTNPRFTEMIGFDHDELFGQSISRIISLEAENNLSKLFENLTSNQSYRRFEAIIERKDGTNFPADTAFAAIARNGETEIVCSLRDISSQKQLESELRFAYERQKELAELKTRFISTVSHEYRTPLAIIQTGGSILLRYRDRMTTDEQRRHLEKILENVSRLTALLDDVLEINRAETVGVEFNPEELDINNLCHEVIEDSRQVNPNYLFEFTVVGEVSFIAADAKLVRQIISNLLSNAVKYSPSRGKVHVLLQFENQQVNLQVRDQGMGIPPDDLDNLFTLFHRAANVGQIHGSGLGLAIVKQAVDAHQGTISVESEVGQGSTFTVTFPA